MCATGQRLAVLLIAVLLTTCLLAAPAAAQEVRVDQLEIDVSEIEAAQGQYKPIPTPEPGHPARMLLDSQRVDLTGTLPEAVLESITAGIISTDGEGRVLMLRYAEGSASTRQREDGFLERVRSAHPGLEIISSDQYAGPTRETAKRASENILNRFGDTVDGVYTPTETSTSGMLLALQDLGRAGRTQFVGFDASDALVEAMRAGEIHGLVVQNPMRMGYLGVVTMVEHLQGMTVERRIDTGVTVITPENLDDPESQALVDPPVEQYLDAAR